MICECCGQPLPTTCIKINCGAKTHWMKSKTSASGVAYQIRQCERGHRFAVSKDGGKAWRWSRAMEHDGMPDVSAIGYGKFRRGIVHGGLTAIRV